MKIKCTIITEPVRNLAKEINKSDSYTNNLISAWQTKNNTIDFPTKENLDKFMQECKQEALDAYFYIPNYDIEPFDENNKFTIKHDSLGITLQELPGDNSMSKVNYFLEKLFPNIPELKDLISPNDSTNAYRFLLWREKYFIEHDLNKNSKNAELANAHALKILKEYVKRQEKPQGQNTVLNNNLNSGEQIITAATETQSAPDNNQKQATPQFTAPEIGESVLNHDTELYEYKLRYYRVFNPMKRQYRGKYIAQIFRDTLDDYITDRIDELEESKNGENNSTINNKIRIFESAEGWKHALDEATPAVIISRIQQELEREYQDAIESNNQERANEYKLMLDHFKALLEDSTLYIEKLTGITLDITTNDYNVSNTNKVEVVSADIESDVEETENIEQEEDINQSGEDNNTNYGLTYKARFVNPLSTRSKEVKNILTRIALKDNKGGLLRDDLGNVQYLDGDYAYVTILSEISRIASPDDFCKKISENSYKLPALEKAAKKYPWIKQVISAIENDPRLVSLFYSTFRQEHINYRGYYKGESEYTSMPNDLTKPEGETSFLNKVTTNIEHNVQFGRYSIYVNNKDIAARNKEHLKEVFNNLGELKGNYGRINDDKFVEEAAKNLLVLLNSVGINTDRKLLEGYLSEDTIQRLNTLIDNLNTIITEEVPENSTLTTHHKQSYQNLARELSSIVEEDVIKSFRDGDKMRYAYSVPSYVHTLFKKMTGKFTYKDFIQNQYGKFEWFKNQTTGKWRSGWLKLIEENPNLRNGIELSEVINIDGASFNEWSPAMINTMFLKQYYSAGEGMAHYNFPNFSDSPCAMFIRFKKFENNGRRTYQEQLIPLFRDVVKQELWRMDYVQKRKEAGAPEIASFDSVGNKFRFFPELNDGTILNRIKELQESRDLKALDNYIDSLIPGIIENYITDFKKDVDIKDITTFLNQNGNIKTNGLNEAERQQVINECISEYVWNQTYATTQIIQLTATDLAYFKNSDDFQKRYKGIYASGIKLNTNAKRGKAVERTIILKDFEIVSPIYTDLVTALNKAVEEGRLKGYDRDNILNKYRKINVADAQAYRTLSSFLDILDMTGKLTPEVEQSIDNIKEGTWDMGDFNLVLSVIKPFLYTQIEKPDGLGGTLKVPHMNKNSEFLLLPFYAFVANPVAGSVKLRAMERFMTDHNIDMIQFESAVKIGKQSPIDINYSESKLKKWTEEHGKEYQAVEEAATKEFGDKVNTKSVFERFKKGNEHLLRQGKITQEEYNNRMSAINPTEEEVYNTLEHFCIKDGEINPNVVHELPYEDYCIQQPTPEHLFDTDVILGVQFVNLITADLPENFKVEVDGIEYSKKEIVKAFEDLRIDLLRRGAEQTSKVFESEESLQKELVRLLQNSGGNKSISDGLKLVKDDTGKTTFNVPLDETKIFPLIESKVTSIIRNGITKIKVSGGSCYQVSDYGLTDELHLIRDNDGNVIGAECYLPAYSKKFYEQYARIDENGKTVIDMNKLPKELREIVGYRIPTESKHSMMSLVIKGFLPQKNGSCIMLPAEITSIAGSDFDIDKMFLIFPEFREHKIYNFKKAWEDFRKEIDENNRRNATDLNINKLFKSMDESFGGALTDLGLTSEREILTDSEEEFKKWFKERKNNYYIRTEFRKVKFDNNKPLEEQSRGAITNQLLDISRAILAHPSVASQLLQPNGYDDLKTLDRVTRIITSKENLAKFIQVNNLVNKNNEVDIEALVKLIKDKIAKRDFKSLDSFLSNYTKERSAVNPATYAYYHKQNSVGNDLIGMFAAQNMYHAKFQHTTASMIDPIILNGKAYKSLSGIVNENNDIITEAIGRGLAAAADNGKEQLLATLNLNMQTANFMGHMLRVGIPVETCIYILTNPAVSTFISEGKPNTRDLRNHIFKAIEYYKTLITQKEQSKLYTLYKYFKSIGVKQYIQKHKSEYGDITSDDLLRLTLESQLMPENTDVLYNNIRTLILFHQIMKNTRAVSKLDRGTRFDSVNAALPSTLSGAKAKVETILSADSSTDPTSGVTEVLNLPNPFTSDNTQMPVAKASFEYGGRIPIKEWLPKYFTILSKEFETNVLETINYVLVTKYNIESPIQENENLLKLAYYDFINYVLSDTVLFGDSEGGSFYDKRNYYINEFPKTLKTLLRAEENKEIRDLTVFKNITINKSGIKILNVSKSNLARESYERDFESLLYSDNPVAQRLAIDLFMYSYYRYGVTPSPHSLMSYFSTYFKTQFTDYIETIRNLRDKIKEKGDNPGMTEFFNNFAVQFLDKYFKGLENPNDSWKYSYKASDDFLDLKEHRNQLIDKETKNNGADSLEGSFPDMDMSYSVNSLESMPMPKFSVSSLEEEMSISKEDSQEENPKKEYTEEEGEAQLENPICKV